MSLPTLTDLRAHVNVVSSADDAELQDMLDAAVDVVSGIVGPIGTPASVTEKHYAMSSDVLVLRRMPVADLVSVSYGTGETGETAVPMNLSDYDFDPETGLVRVATGGRFVGSYTVTYTSGRSALPAAIRLAVLEVAAHLWKTQRGPAPVGPLADPEDALSTPGFGYAIPNRAVELLAPYARPTIA